VAADHTSIPDRLEYGIFTLFLAVLVWAPLPFASNRLWSGAILVSLIGLLLAGWLVLYFLGGSRVSAQVWRVGRWPLFLLLAVQLWVLLQLLPLPASLVSYLSPRAYSWHLEADYLSITLDKDATAYYLRLGATYCASFFLCLALVNSHARVKLLLQVLVFSGTFQAAYGAFMVLSGLELGFFVEKYSGIGVATGTFVNRNHMAGYLVMCLSAGIGLLMSQLSSRNPSTWKDRFRQWLKLMLSAKVRLRIYLAIMVVALVLTRARMGNIAFFSALGLAGVVAMIAGRQFSGKVLLFLSSLFVVDMLILGKWFGFDKLVERLKQTNPDIEPRRWSNEYTLDYIADFPLTGSGGGSFYGVFPNYQGSDLRGFHQHAHNDYLQITAELGVPVTTLLVGFVVLAAWSAYQIQRRRQSALYKGAAFAVIMTLAWAGIHSATDFNLQIPANALTFVVILSLAFVCRGLPARGGG